MTPWKSWKNMLFSILSDQNLNGIFSTYYKHFQDIILVCTSSPPPTQTQAVPWSGMWYPTHITSYGNALTIVLGLTPLLWMSSWTWTMILNNRPTSHLVTALLWGTTCLTFTPEYRCFSVSLMFYSGLHPPYPQTLDFLTMKYKLKAEFYYLLFSLFPSLFLLYVLIFSSPTFLLFLFLFWSITTKCRWKVLVEKYRHLCTGVEACDAVAQHREQASSRMREWLWVGIIACLSWGEHTQEWGSGDAGQKRDSGLTG